PALVRLPSQSLAATLSAPNVASILPPPADPDHPSPRTPTFRRLASQSPRLDGAWLMQRPPPLRSSASPARRIWARFWWCSPCQEVRGVGLLEKNLTSKLCPSVSPPSS